MAVLAFVAVPRATEPAGSARAFVASAFNLSAAELTRIDAGQVVARTTAAQNRREVATFGIVRIKTTTAAYLERLADIVTFKRNENVIQIGTFSNPPQLSDLAGLTLDDDDVQRLRACQVGNCGVRLSAAAIQRFRNEIDWRAPDASLRASSVLRQVLVEYVARYREVGPSGAMEYADTSSHLNTGKEFASLAQAESATWRHVPALRQHLSAFPGSANERTNDLVYWSKERVNGRPVISVTHLATVRLDDSTPVTYAIASKQIYAMHYFDASLGITLLVPDTTASSPGIYVVYLNRSRIDLFDGFFGGIARKVVAGKARSLVADLLGRLQKSFES